MDTDDSEMGGPLKDLKDQAGDKSLQKISLCLVAKNPPNLMVYN